MLRFTGKLKEPEIKKRVTFLDTIESIEIPKDYFDFAKNIHEAKNRARNEFDKTSKWKRKNNYIHSTKHNESDLFLGILGELMVAIQYDVQENWVNDQQNQITSIIRNGRFDITDVGNTQIRTIDYKPWQLMSVIIRPRDMENKQGQPTIGCVISPKEMWIKICGWTTMELARQIADTGDPTGRGNGLWIAPYHLNPMSTFDKSFLS